MTRADPRLYVALDLPGVEEARALTAAIGDAVISYKIGLQLLPIGGMDLARELIDQGKHVFLDFKFHDIDATVEKAVRSVAGLGADILTVHARPDVMAAAARGKAGSGLRVIGVTVLTSLNKPALEAIGYTDDAQSLVMRRTQQALDAGVDGIVSSPLEAAAARKIVPDDFLIVTPGVRMPGGDKGDQKRVATPFDAIKNGASHIVVGRPINAARDPRAAAIAITANMRGGS
ncbi:orotidine-5'-phosphate decarboxylase [Robiginitomaculum antarcticum]|uniref:orotidine-5'-phosphate decarboxylase n=1 Tax=Robiginitomaculum antarcticum TaxID=437507 RepID=UPI0003818BAE|nr:orotidine-5'-phosphate decarboxylase [Robiginitomaculum antarcticum]